MFYKVKKISTFAVNETKSDVALTGRVGMTAENSRSIF